VAPPAGAAGLRPLRLAFSDGLFTSGDAAARGLWLGRGAALGAQVVRMDAGWPASTRPSRPADPADPAYDFVSLDAAVRDAAAHGLIPLLSFTGAPRWAEGPGRPASAPPGSWLPDPSAVGAYGQALAARYDGRFPDPLHAGGTLPRVSSFQLWNEPNLSQYLTPQWQHGAGGWVARAADQYRLMLNAFYAGVKASQPGATVVTAGTSPYGDVGHGTRTMPVRFWSEVLRAPVAFDVLAHQPYSVGAPPTQALNPDDVSIPDIGKLTKLVRAAERRGAALPRGEHHRVWVTETSYVSRPPNPSGVPLGTDARWLEQTLFLLWSQGVELVTWYQIRDPPPPEPDASGVYFYGGGAKPAAAAFRFPVVGHRVAGGGLRAWIRAPHSGSLVLQTRTRGRWGTVRRVGVTAAEVLDVALPGHPQAVRASVGATSSVAWAF
jgi:hypothetical protein